MILWYNYSMTGQKREKRKIAIDFNRFFSNNWHYLVVLIFGVILSVGVWARPLQVMTGNDYAFHVTRLQSASKGWANGQIIPQVDPDTLDGFGYGYNLFYGPLLTYLAAGLQALVNFWPIAINLVLVVCLIGAGMTMCYAMSKISKNKVLALLVAVFYMAAPYVLNNLYARMALGEVAAAVAAPILLLGLYQLTVGEKHAARSIAISAAMLLLSHSLSAMLFALMAAAYVLLNLRKIVNWENIWRMVLGAMVALGLTAFFTLPLLEAKLADNYGVFDAGYSDVYFGANPRSMNDHRAWPQQLMIMDYTGKVNADGLGGEFGITLGMVAIVGLLGFWFVRKRTENEDQRRLVTSLYIIAALAIVLALPVINWHHMPGILWQMQFPWRTLGVATICLAVVSGYTIYGLLRGLSDDKQRVAAVLTGVLAIYLVMPLILPREDRRVELDSVRDDPVTIGWEAEYAPMQLLCSPDVEEDVAEGYACSLGRIREILAERGDDVRVVSGGVILQQASRDGLKMNLIVNNPSNEDAVVELPMIYYPGYQATMDDMNLQVGASYEYGLVAVTIPAGSKGEVKVAYGLSLATQLGGIISVTTAGLGAIWVIVSGIRDHSRRKKRAEMSSLMDSVREVVEDDMLEMEFNREAEKEEILASLGEPVPPEVSSVAPSNLPVSPLMTSDEITDTSKEPKTTKRTRTKKTTTKTANTRGRKKAQATAQVDEDKKPTKAKTTRATAAKKTTKVSKKVATSETPRRSTTTRVRTVKSDEVEE